MPGYSRPSRGLGSCLVARRYEALAPTSGGYGHSLERSLAVAYLDADVAEAGTPLAVEILGARRPARVLAEPPFDPENLRPRS
jgi:glycine cleavage system aminomethyltransferase T